MHLYRPHKLLSIISFAGKPLSVAILLKYFLYFIQSMHVYKLSNETLTNIDFKNSSWGTLQGFQMWEGKK